MQQNYVQDTLDSTEDDDDFDAYKGQKFDLIGYQDFLPNALNQNIFRVGNFIKDLVTISKTEPQSA